MKTREFAEQIDHLLWTGAIEGHQVLSLYYLLQSYQQGKLSGVAMQGAINQCDPDQIEKLLDEQFPPLYELSVTGTVMELRSWIFLPAR